MLLSDDRIGMAMVLGEEVCGLERCGGNATSVLGRWGRGEWRAGMKKAASRVVLGDKRGAARESNSGQQW